MHPSHRAKCTTFRNCYAEFVLAIRANPIALKNALYAQDLITKQAHKSRSANKIASSCEDTLRYDKDAWEKLIEVLRRSDGGGIIADKLTDKLRELLPESMPDEDIPRAQQQNLGESPCCITIIARLCYCCVPCICWANESRDVHGLLFCRPSLACVTYQ